MSSLIHKKLFYLLGAMVFLAMTGCTPTQESTTPPPTTPPPTAPQAKACFQKENLPVFPKQACAVTNPKLLGHYDGGCQSGKAHGRGLAIGKDIYEGDFANGLPHGQGTYTWLDKQCFTGQFINGVAQVPHVGCYVADVRLQGSYSGECRNGKAYGRGKAVGIDTYEGGFIDGTLDGQGTYVWANGDRYLGRFKKGEPYGRGTMMYVDGTKENVEN